MKTIIVIILALVSIEIIGQNLSECGLDNNPVLTQVESEYLNDYLAAQRNEFDFQDKKVIFITGSSGSIIGTKVEYFEHIKRWNDKNARVATGIEVLTEKQKMESNGFDVIITYWVKVLTEKQKKKLLKQIKTMK